MRLAFLALRRARSSSSAGVRFRWSLGMARRKQGGGGSDSSGQIKHHSSLFGTTLAGASLVLHSPVFGPRTLYDPWAGACRTCYLHIRVNASQNFGTKDKLGDSTEQTRKLEPAPWRSGMAHLPLFSHISRWDLTSTHSHTSWTRATTIPLDLSLPASSTANSYFAPLLYNPRTYRPHP